MENKEKNNHKQHNDNKKEKEIKKDKCKCNEEHDLDGICNNGECSCSNENDERELLSKRIKELEDDLLRSKAELLNYRKRKDEETLRVIKYAEEDILKGFLPILDNFERAIDMDDDNLNDEVSKFLEGFKLMYKQIKELLNKFEVKEIECLGKVFDPTYHQAVVMDKDETKESGIVTEVLQKGYMYKDRVLRTAMVKVNE
ncbi:MAG: nucleotide exchange factor GrpE [Bacilli bacterium]